MKSISITIYDIIIEKIWREHFMQSQIQYVRNHIEIAKNEKFIALMFLLSLLFTSVSLFFVVTSFSWFIDTIKYNIMYQETFYITTLFLYILCFISTIISIIIMLRHYLSYWHKRLYLIERCHHVGLLLLTMIPGFLALTYTAAASRNFDFDIMDIACFSIMICIPSFLLYRLHISHRIEKSIWQIKSFNLNAFKLLFCFFFMLLICTEMMLSREYIILTFSISCTVPCIFFTCLACRFLFAHHLYLNAKDDMVEFECYEYNADAFEDHSAIKERLIILNSGNLLLAEDVMEEFDFDKAKVRTAILKNEYIHVFSDEMYFNIDYLHLLLQRLAYEDIAFRVERLKNGTWQPYTQADYDAIQPENIQCKPKSEDIQAPVKKKPRNVEKLSLSQKIIYTPFLIIYFTFIFLFPVNYYRPVNWMSKKALKKTYHVFTYRNIRTLGHIFIVFIIIILLLCNPSLFESLANNIGSATAPLYGMCILFFIGELIHFPIYMTQIEKALTKTQHQTHNYFVYAFILYLISITFKMFTRGIQKGLSQIFILILSVEAARSIILIYRFIKHKR